jgi:hypothetical protein
VRRQDGFIFRDERTLFPGQASFLQQLARPNKEDGTVMIKVLSVSAIAAFMAAALTVLPGFAPEVKASSPVAPASDTAVKSDRLPIQKVRIPCAQQSWPNVDASCLRRDGSETAVRSVRIITADRS